MSALTGRSCGATSNQRYNAVVFFRERFQSVCDCLDARFRGMQRLGQNPADRGELCEVFVREFLSEFLEGNLCAFRGGKVVDIHGAESAQMDVVLTGQGTLRIFRDKGIYPIETVFGLVSVTSTLDLPKLKECVEGFRTVPSTDPQFMDMGRDHSAGDLAGEWQKRFPVRCVFGFRGSMDETWEKWLTETATNDAAALSYLPHIVIVNKIGMIERLRPGTRFTDGTIAGKPFHYRDFTDGQHYLAVPPILNRLYEACVLAQWFRPQYSRYFNVDAAAD